MVLRRRNRGRVMLPNDRPEAMFPKLDAAQIARIEPFGRHRKVELGELVFDQGEEDAGFYVVLTGSLEVVNPSCEGEIRVMVLGHGDFTGEVAILAGRRTLVRVRALEASELLHLDSSSLRARTVLRHRAS